MRSAIIGVSGARARAHADGYRRLDPGILVAVSARTPGAASSFAADYPGVTAFSDHREMLDSVQPDIVHVNTPPSARLDILRDCESAGVGAVLIEKPVAIDWPDLNGLRAFAAATSMRVVVNHQLHFHRALIRLREFADGAPAARREIDASAGLNAAYQGTHLMQIARAILPSEVTSLAAWAAGGNGLAERPSAHYAPDDLDAFYYTPAGSIRMRCGTGAPRVADPRAIGTHFHKRIRVSVGRDTFEWTMWSWSSFKDGRSESDALDWVAENDLAQAELTRALVDGDDEATRPIQLGHALDEYALILDAYDAASRLQSDAPRRDPVLPRLMRVVGPDEPRIN